VLGMAGSSATRRCDHPLGLTRTVRPNPAATCPFSTVLRGTGSTSDDYVYYNSLAGEGNAHEKAYAAAFRAADVCVLALRFSS